MDKEILALIKLEVLKLMAEYTDDPVELEVSTKAFVQYILGNNDFIYKESEERIRR